MAARRPGIRGPGIVLLLLAAVIVMCAGPAAAAADPMITPADRASVAAVPGVVRVAQPEPIETGLARAEVRGPRGAVSRAASVGVDDPQAILIAVPRDGPGTYRVAWAGMTVDGHPFAGTSVFAVRTASPVAAQAQVPGSDGAGPLAVIARLLVLIGVLGMAGLALTREWVLSRAWVTGGLAPPGATGGEALRDRAAAHASPYVIGWWRALWVLLAAWVAGLALALPVQAAAVGGQWSALLGDTRWGAAWIGLLVLAAAGALVAAVVRGRDPGLAPSGALLYIIALPGLLGAVLLSWSGHAARGTDATLGTALDIAHGWATAAWLGGLVMLLVLAMPLLAALGSVDRVRLGAAIVVRFSTVAVIAVVVLVITGTYRALAELPSLSALWSTDYGLALLVKLAVFAVMLVLAAGNRFVIHPRLERSALGLAPADASDGVRALAASVRVEVLLGVAVLAAVAVMVVLMPPT